MSSVIILMNYEHMTYLQRDVNNMELEKICRMHEWRWSINQYASIFYSPFCALLYNSCCNNKIRYIELRDSASEGLEDTRVTLWATPSVVSQIEIIMIQMNSILLYGVAIMPFCTTVGPSMSERRRASVMTHCKAFKGRYWDPWKTTV